MEKISMNREHKKVTVEEGFEKYIRLKKLKNLSPETIKHYEEKYLYFSRFFDVSKLYHETTEKSSASRVSLYC